MPPGPPPSVGRGEGREKNISVNSQMDFEGDFFWDLMVAQMSSIVRPWRDRKIRAVRLKELPPKELCMLWAEYL